MAVSAAAHLSVATRSLRMMIASSDLVVVARPVGVEEVLLDEGGAPGRRPVLRIEVLEVLKGPPVQGELRFAQQGHGAAVYAPGDEALLFLRDVSKSRELRKWKGSDALRWYSDQEHDDAYVLRPATKDLTVQAAKSYVAAAKMPADERQKALRHTTVALLASRDPQLAGSALQDLVQTPDSNLVTRADLPELRKVIADSKAPIGVRVGLLSELQRRGLVDGTRSWVRLLRSTRGKDNLTVIRAARAHQAPASDR